MEPADLLTSYRALVARVDEHARRVHGDRPRAFACAAGCSGCCQAGLTVFPIEAEAIRQWLAGAGGRSGAGHPPAAGLPDRRVEPSRGGGCALLDAAGRCTIHPARPLLCRTHGLPLVIRDDDGELVGDVCPLNFDGGAGLAELESTDFLAVDTVNAVLASLHAAWCGVSGADPEERVPLADLARA